jgi:hypothetical protein
LVGNPELQRTQEELLAMGKAIEPDRRSSPKRTLVVAVSGFVAVLFSVFWALLREARERALKDPGKARRLELLRHYLRRRSV